MISAANHVPLTPLSFLARARRAFPDKVAVVDADESPVSYAELGRDCDALAGALRADGVQPGDRVTVLDLNSRWLLAAHFAVPGAGAALVALNTRLAASEYRDILAHSRAEILLVSGDMLPRLDVRTAAELPVRRVVLLPGTPATALPGAVSYDEWLADTDGRGILLPADEDAMIAVNYTSGTTGRPKGVIYTHRGAYLNAVSVALEFELSAASCLLWTLPMFHCNGWSMTWGATAVGATHICLGSFDPQRALDLAGRYPVSHLCGAPVVLSELARAGAQRGFTAERPLRAAVGGAPPTKETIAAVQKMGITVTHLYGLTETYGPSLVCEYQQGWTELPAADLAERLSRQGVPAISVADVQIADDKLRPLPADGSSAGEILIRSNTVAAGYLDDAAATAEAFRGGWFHTGDLGVMHADGYIELTDRSKDIIISGGENIASVEVEKALAAHPDVIEAAVVARPDPRWGERPVAFVTTERADLSEAELTEFVRGRLAHFKAPDQVYFETLPKTSTGKIQKNVLRDRARERGRLCGVAPGLGQGHVAGPAAFPVQARGDDRDLVGLGEFFHLQESLGHGLRFPGHHPGVVLAAGTELPGAREVTYLLGPQRLTYPAADVLDGQRPRRFEVDDRLVVVAGEGQHRHHRVGRSALNARCEPAAVFAQRLERQVRAHVMSEGRAHSVHRGKTRPVGTGAQHEQLRLLVHQRRGHQLSVRMAGRESVTQERQQLSDLRRKLRGRIGDHPPAQDVRGQRIGARRPAQRQVDAPRVHRQQGAEHLRDLERGVVRQHDSGRADPDARGMRADVRGQQFGCAARQAVHVVMLGDPVPPVAGGLHGLGDAHRTGN